MVMENGNEPTTGLRSYGTGIFAALITAGFTIIACSSYAALIFSGPLSALAPQGLAIALYTALVVGAYVALTSSFQGTIAIPQDRIAPILAIMVTSIAGTLQAVDAPPEVIVSTTLACIPIVALITGLFLLSLGLFRLGNLIRYIPYPVIGGFLAGSGWLLAYGGLEVATGLDFSLRTLPTWFTPPLLVRWVPAAVFGTLMFATLKRWRYPWVPPVMLGGAILLFYLMLLTTGIDMQNAVDRHWLPMPPPEATDIRLFDYTIFAETDWLAFFIHWDLLATILLTSVVSILLTASGLELSAREEIDLNAELRSTGLANLLSAVGGGMVGFHSLSLSGLVLNLGGRGRFIGVLSALICGGALFAGAGFTSFIPFFVSGGLLFFLGISFLWEWVVEGWTKLNLLDYGVVIVILAAVGFLGYPAGVGTGILLATLLFIHNYSRVHIVTRSFQGGEITSNVDRPVSHLRQLRENSHQIYAISLQGYIFFGTANHLVNVVREKVETARDEHLRFLILDFHRVSGIDSSALLSLTKIRTLAIRKNFQILLCHLHPGVRRQMERARFIARSGTLDEVMHAFPDLDHALEYSENIVLGINSDEELTRDAAFEDQFQAQGGGGHSAQEARELLAYMEHLEMPAGETLIVENDEADALYYVEKGLVTVQITLGNGKTVRLRKMTAGTFVGEIGLYLGVPRTARVVTEAPCSFYKLSAENLERMRREKPRLAAQFNHFMVCLLAERVSNMGVILRTVLD